MDTSSYKIAVSRYALTAKIPPGDSFWHKFNGSFENQELTVSDLLTSIYDGHPITTHHKNNWRSSENYLCGQHIGLDFDAGDLSSSMPVLLKDKFIQKYAAFIYTTPSHTVDCPRSRAIFLLDQPIMQAKNYVLAVSSLLWMFGTADRQCKDAVRFFYGSKNCDFEYINQVLPLEVVRKLIANYQETGANEKRKSLRRDYLPAPEQRDVAEALKMIPPWGIAYDEWVSVLMGIHAAFGDGGYALAEQWADGRKGEVEQKWHSFKKDGNTTGAVTVGTVFGLAKRYGWQRSMN